MVQRLSPEPFASHVDILTAAQAIEVAIHANDSGQAVVAIDQALGQIYNAWKYLRDGGYVDLAASASGVWHMLSGLRAQAQGPGLQAFLSGPLYDFQGVLRWLDQQLLSVG